LAPGRSLFRRHPVLRNAEEPSGCDLVTDFGVNVRRSPSLGLERGDNVELLLEDCVSGKIALDIFAFEGTVVNAPNGAGARPAQRLPLR